jgi:hypothetical protein
MPQKKGKKENKKVIKAVIKNVKQPLLKNSINIKIDLDDDNDKKKKPKRKRRQQKETKETTNNDAVSYVDEVGKPISNEYINKSFTGSYMPQPFSRNSTVIGTSFNESAIMDKVMEKMSKLNNTSNMSLNQSTNNTSLNQSGAAPTRLAPPQLPRPALSTIAPVSPSVAPQSLNFNLSSPVRPVGMTPLQASSMAMNTVQQYAMASMRAATNTQEVIDRIFSKIQDDYEKAEIKRASVEVRNGKNHAFIMEAAVGGARANRFKSIFKDEYKGTMYYKDAGEVGYEYYNTLPQ